MVLSEQLQEGEVTPKVNLSKHHNREGEQGSVLNLENTQTDRTLCLSSATTAMVQWATRLLNGAIGPS